jgi:hypothetical protein
LGSEAAEEERLPKKFFFQSRFGGWVFYICTSMLRKKVAT